MYLKITQPLKTPDDIEWIARPFFESQADQNVRYCEVIYSPYDPFEAYGIPLDEQLDTINRARDWALAQKGVKRQFICRLA